MRQTEENGGCRSCRLSQADLSQYKLACVDYCAESKVACWQSPACRSAEPEVVADKVRVKWNSLEAQRIGKAAFGQVSSEFADLSR